MTGVRGRYRARCSGSRPNSSGSTTTSTSSTAAPHISRDISPASLPSASPVATPTIASSPTLPAESPKIFQWDPTIDALVRREWAQKAAKRYIDNIRKWHANGKLIFVSDDVWDSWMQKWEQDEAFKKRSTQASLNHLSETCGLGAGPSRHTGGSISSAEHKRRIEMYRQLLEQATQPNEGSEEPQQPDCDQIFIQAAGGKNKKKRIYGTGSLSQSKFSDVGSSSSVSSGLNENPVIQEMTEKLKVQLEQINSQAEQINSQAERINSQAEQINSIAGS
ncbi:uncharacterized protein LOC127791835 [Diospyros lotus]|uniref:uncharacterized protein LOC127791835 n=1 Tax=Diospyros lotus TaxID=55363 RepID=UPI0022587FA4|nr:uncharacterized protein LOC127791835 [Diospyros lotus]